MYRYNRSPLVTCTFACLALGLGAATLIKEKTPPENTGNGITAAAPASGGITVRARSTHAFTLVIPGLDPSRSTLSAADFTVQCPRSLDYRKPLAPARLGLDRQATGHTDDRTALNETRLHLLLPYALRDGEICRLDAPAAGVNGLPVSWREQQVTGSIQLDQVGYAPTARKIAYVGNWLGTAGPLPVQAETFRVVDATTGDSVLEGRLQLRAAADPWSGNDVHTADFSALKVAGHYRLTIQGLGQSDSFRIADDVYDSVYRTTARYFYHHRNSTPVVEPWAEPGYARPDGIPARHDAVFHPAVAAARLGNGEPANGRHAVSGGWFDAGDYGQYIPNAAPVWYAFAAALDIAPQQFGDSDLNIPESGNGLPDLIDELEWGMDWALDMQDPGDGGVYFRVASATWDGGLPQEVGADRLIAEKTTHATAAFAAMAAIHARLLSQARPARAATVLDAARAAWQFLLSHPQWPAEGERYRNPPDIHAGEYPDTSAQDNILWAAAELYRSTGEAQYHNAFRALVEDVKIDPTGVVSFKDQGMAAHWAYLMAPWPDRDEALVRRARELFLAAADWRVRKMQEHPFHAPVHQHRGFLGWGSFAHSTRATLTLVQAWYLSCRPDYLEWAWLTPHPQLGANPQSLSYITGIGARAPLHPLSKLSQHDGIDAPLPGIPVNGPHAHLPPLWPSMRSVNAAYYPETKTPHQDGDEDGYPVLRRYTDSPYLPPMSEPTVAEAARTAVAFGLLRSANNLQSSTTPLCEHGH